MNVLITKNSEQRDTGHARDNSTSQDDLLMCLHCYDEHKTTDCTKLQDLDPGAQLLFIKENEVCEKCLDYHNGEIAGSNCEIANGRNICVRCVTHHHRTISCKAVEPNLVRCYYTDPHLLKQLPNVALKTQALSTYHL